MALAGSAPLVGTPDAPTPEGAAAEWFAGAGGLRLRAALFPAKGRARGSVVVSPGRTEAIEKYFEVATELAVRGFVTLAHDWRGQGLADRLLPDRLLGHAAGYQDFLTDYAALLGTFEPHLPRPWIALGHSMGGCLTLLALAEGERRFGGAILSAPMLGVRVGAVPRLAARALASVLTAAGRGGRPVPGPAATSTPFESNIVTHDRARFARAEGLIEACPDLALGLPTWGWLDFAFVATSRLARGPGATRIDIPVTVVAAGDDRLVDNTALKAVTARLPRGRYVEIAGAFHELLQETDEVQAAFWREFDALAAQLVPEESLPLAKT
ncbi:MAG: lysophospholipase [Caulobacteraceae bacterium]|nr:lysophospholipase [Caulobacteraceae bacterium]